MKCSRHLILSGMAKSSWNVSGAINNPAGMGAFISAAELYLAKRGAGFHCRNLQTDVREGHPGPLTLIIAFESLAAAKAAYEALETKRCSIFIKLTTLSRFRSSKKAIRPTTHGRRRREGRLPFSSVATATGGTAWIRK